MADKRPRPRHLAFSRVKPDTAERLSLVPPLAKFPTTDAYDTVGESADTKP